MTKASSSLTVDHVARVNNDNPSNAKSFRLFGSGRNVWEAGDAALFLPRHAGQDEPLPALPPVSNVASQSQAASVRKAGFKVLSGAVRPARSSDGTTSATPGSNGPEKSLTNATATGTEVSRSHGMLGRNGEPVGPWRAAHVHQARGSNGWASGPNDTSINGVRGEIGCGFKKGLELHNKIPMSLSSPPSFSKASLDQAASGDSSGAPTPSSMSAASRVAPESSSFISSRQRATSVRSNRSPSRVVGKDYRTRTTSRPGSPHAESDRTAMLRGGLSSFQIDKKHPLEHTWSLYVLKDAEKRTQDSWNDKQIMVHQFSTVEDFWCMINHIHPPSQIGVSDYSLFKKDIKPAWEDPSVAQGGRWVAKLPNKPSLLDDVWLYTVLMVIGESLAIEYSDAVCGVVASVRPRVLKIALWISLRDEERAQTIGNAFYDILMSRTEVKDRPLLEVSFQSFQDNVEYQLGNNLETPSRYGEVSSFPSVGSSLSSFGNSAALYPSHHQQSSNNNSIISTAPSRSKTLFFDSLHNGTGATSPRGPILENCQPTYRALSNGRGEADASRSNCTTTTTMSTATASMHDSAGLIFAHNAASSGPSRFGTSCFETEPWRGTRRGDKNMENDDTSAQVVAAAGGRSPILV